MGSSSPRFGVKIKNISNHHPNNFCNFQIWRRCRKEVYVKKSILFKTLTWQFKKNWHLLQAESHIKKTCVPSTCLPPFCTCFQPRAKERSSNQLGGFKDRQMKIGIFVLLVWGHPGCRNVQRPPESYQGFLLVPNGNLKKRSGGMTSRRQSYSFCPRNWVRKTVSVWCVGQRLEFGIDRYHHWHRRSLFVQVKKLCTGYTTSIFGLWVGSTILSKSKEFQFQTTKLQDVFVNMFCSIMQPDSKNAHAAHVTKKGRSIPRKFTTSAFQRSLLQKLRVVKTSREKTPWTVEKSLVTILVD